jgi:ribonucleoside-triphosphate reductase
MQKNLEALETMIKFIYENIQYAEFNTKSDYCHECGFNGEIEINDDNERECPQCPNKNQKKMNVVRRTCGYLGEKFRNVGKTKEIKSRVLHL